MTEPFCCEIDIDYAISVWSNGLVESVLALGMSPSELLDLPSADFFETVRALPLEVLDLISLGDDDEFCDGMARIPDDVFAQIFALNYGIDAAEFLKQPRQDRPAYLLVYGDVPVETLQSFSALQLNEYYESMANGYSRRVAAARAINASKDRKGDRFVDDAQSIGTLSQTKML